MRRFIFMLLLGPVVSLAQIQNEIIIPQIISGDVIPLNLHMGTQSFFEGPFSNTYGINQYDYLGPTIELNHGQMVQMEVTNNLDDTTNLHWHGLQVPAVSDGPMTMMMMGEVWTPSFEVINRAGTYWYHPHVHKKTAMQALKGAAGFIIVRDTIEANWDLPRTYGVDDFPIVFQSIQYDSLNQALPRGMNDSTIFVNGVRGNYGYEATLHVPAQWIRLRILNGSGERTFNVGLNNNQNFSVIASDNGLLSQAVNTNRIRISPGERYEILLNLTDLNGTELSLWNWGTELPMGVQGGPTMPMPAGSPDMSSPLNGNNFTLLKLLVVNPTPNPVNSVTTQFEQVQLLDPNAVNQQRVIVMSAQNLMNMDGPFFFNNLTFDMDRIDYAIPLNSTETWILQNQTMVAHPFHMHDVAFQVVSRDGNLPVAQDRGWKDVVLIHPQETVVLIAKFDVYADSMTPYVYHCHILMHEDDGMMGQFIVTDPSMEVSELQPSKEFSIFPNPTAETLQWNGNAPIDQIQIWSLSGEKVITQSINAKNSLDLKGLAKGTYVVLARSKEKTFARKLIIQ